MEQRQTVTHSLICNTPNVLAFVWLMHGAAVATAVRLLKIDRILILNLWLHFLTCTKFVWRVQKSRERGSAKKGPEKTFPKIATRNENHIRKLAVYVSVCASLCLLVLLDCVLATYALSI